jgi:hypothetical protein
MHPFHSCSIFGELAAEEKASLKNNNMCPFCMRNGVDQDCFGQGKGGCKIDDQEGSCSKYGLLYGYRK